MSRNRLRHGSRHARENGLAERFTGLDPAEEERSGRVYPIVVANILARTLIELEPLLKAKLAPGGVLVLSGIWGAEQAASVADAFSGAGYGDATTVFLEEWALVRVNRL